MKRFGQLIGVKPEMLEEYKRYHAAVWPDVLAMITRVQHPQLLDLHKDNLLFAYFEYVGDDFDADMAKMAADPETQRWWDIMMPMQAPIPTRAEGEWWAGGLEVVGDFAAGLIDGLDDVDHDVQALAGVGLCHQFFDQGHTGKDHALAGAGDVRKEAVLNRVVLGTVGRVVGNANFEAQFIGEFLEVFFEDEVMAVIAPAAIAAGPTAPWRGDRRSGHARATTLGCRRRRTRWCPC